MLITWKPTARRSPAGKSILAAVGCILLALLPGCRERACHERPAATANADPENRTASPPQSPAPATPTPPGQRKVPPPARKAPFLTGRWKTEHLEYIEFQTSGYTITGGHYRYRNSDVTGTITGGVMRGDRASYRWQEEEHSGTATVELQSDGSLAQKTEWQGKMHTIRFVRSEP